MEVVEYNYIDSNSKIERTLLMEKKMRDKLDVWLVSLALLNNEEITIEFLGLVKDQEMIVITFFDNNDRRHITCIYKDYIHEGTNVNIGSLLHHTLERKTFSEAIDYLNAN